MHLALLVEEAAARRHRERTLVPDAGMDVDAKAAVRPEGDEGLGLQVVARQRRRHHERLAVQWPEQLSAVGMIIAMPQQHAAIARRHAGLGGALRRIAEADDVVAANRLVTAQEFVAAPFAGKDAFGGAALDAGPGVELAPAGQRPRHDLDPMLVRITHDLAVALEGSLVG